MSWTTMPNAMTQGVRRLQTLGALWGLGLTGSAVGDDMVANGYNSVIIGNLVAAGATETQLQYLYDNYGAGTPEFGQAATQLQASLSPSGSIFDLNPTVTAISSSVINPTAATPGAAMQAAASTTPPALVYHALTNTPAASGNLPVAPGTPPYSATGVYTTPYNPAPYNPFSLANPPGLPSPPTPQNFEQWLLANGGWVVGIFAAIVILPPLIKKL